MANSRTCSWLICALSRCECGNMSVLHWEDLSQMQKQTYVSSMQRSYNKNYIYAENCPSKFMRFDFINNDHRRL